MQSLGLTIRKANFGGKISVMSTDRPTLLYRIFTAACQK